MPQNSIFKFGLLSAAATLGAVQLASGHDLADRFRAVAEPASSIGVNRLAKSDREAPPRTGEPARTVQIRMDRLVDTSVLIRIPGKDVRDLRRPLPPVTGPGGETGRMKVACEPVVSMLTEVAKRLEPGRCVT